MQEIILELTGDARKYGLTMLSGLHFTITRPEYTRGPTKVTLLLPPIRGDPRRSHYSSRLYEGDPRRSHYSSHLQEGTHEGHTTLHARQREDSIGSHARTCRYNSRNRTHIIKKKRLTKLLKSICFLCVKEKKVRKGLKSKTYEK